MFSIRERISGKRAYDSKFFNSFIRDLHDAGFDQIRIKLPHNLVGAENAEQSVEEFLKRERNYPSLIVVSENEDEKELLKVLFVNTSRKTFFMDDTFPSGHSEPPEIYVRSADPARAYALLKFFVHYFERGSRESPSTWQYIIALVAFVIVLAEIISLIINGQMLLSSVINEPYIVIVDILVLMGSLVLIYQYMGTPAGLFINEKPKRNLFQLARRALAGEYRDNPLVTIIVTVITSILTALVLRALGII